MWWQLTTFLLAFFRFSPHLPIPVELSSILNPRDALCVIVITARVVQFNHLICFIMWIPSFTVNMILNVVPTVVSPPGWFHAYVGIWVLPMSDVWNKSWGTAVFLHQRVMLGLLNTTIWTGLRNNWRKRKDGNHQQWRKIGVSWNNGQNNHPLYKMNQTDWFADWDQHPWPTYIL